MEEKSITICHLYPDLLNLYGDRGNIAVLQKRCEWRGINANVVSLGVGDDVDFSEVDLFFMGGGQDFDQYTLESDLGIGKPGSKAARLTRAIEDDAPVLAICGGYQILGQYYVGADGQRAGFIGAIPVYTEAGNDRLIGNVMFEATALEGSPLVVGFENHAGRTRLEPGATPLGKVVSGYGNNGEDGTEGIRYRNVVATYSHGPLLPKNPQVADALIGLACERKYPGFELSPLDDVLETQAHDVMARRLSN